MTKKMTLKEFKEVLKEAEIDLDIWGYEGILNIISGYYMHEVKEEKSMGINPKFTERKAYAIYDILTERGFYDDCKAGE